MQMEYPATTTVLSPEGSSLNGIAATGSHLNTPDHVTHFRAAFAFVLCSLVRHRRPLGTKQANVMARRGCPCNLLSDYFPSFTR